MGYQTIDLTDRSLLDLADGNADTDAERNFVNGLRGCVDSHGASLVLSGRQVSKLKCIADPACPVTFGPGGTVV